MNFSSRKNLKIKICGLTNLLDLQKSVSLGAHFFGFIFFKKSPRYIPPKKAAQILNEINKNINSVGVFVNETYDNIMKIIDETKIRIIQLHGNESQETIDNLKKNNIKVIKAVSIKDKNSLNALKIYEPDFFLLDTWHPNLKGGIGKTFNWEIIPKDIFKSSFIAGGLNPENINTLLNFQIPYAVDISSGVEQSFGIKDHNKLSSFFDNIF